MSVFVTIHGIDGTGKTTLASMLPNTLQSAFEAAVYLDDTQYVAHLTTPENVLTPYERSVAKKIQQSGIVRALLDQGKSVIRDRWMIDVAANRSFADNIRHTAQPEVVLRPSLSVILVCDEAVRMQRIRSRELPTQQDLIPNTPGTRACFFENFLLEHIDDFAESSLVLDTTSIPPDRAAQCITERILDVSRL